MKLFLARNRDPAESFMVYSSVFDVLETTYFVGREQELNWIHERLKQNGSRRIVVLHGLGGMGKTQLALNYAKRHRGDYSAVFWLNSKDEETLKHGFVKAARRIVRDHPSASYLKTAAESQNLDDVVDAVQRWLDRPKNDGWLLVYDNHDTPKLGRDTHLGAYDITRFLPEADHGAIIITTRSSQLRIGHRLPIQKLTDIQQSLEILSHSSGRLKLDQGK